MGGEICFKAGLRNKVNYDGVILLMPALRDNPMDAPFLKKFSFIGKCFPRMRTAPPDFTKDSKYDLDEYIRKE